MENLESILAHHPFFEGLDARYVQLVAGCGSNAKFDAGEFLFREGQEADAFFLIRRGKIAVEAFEAARGPLIIDTLTDGDILGWSWLIPPYNWHFDAKAVELTRVIALDGRCLRAKCEQDHDLGYELLKRFSGIIEERLQATRMQMLDLYSVGS